MAERWYCLTASGGDQTATLDRWLPETLRRVSDWEPFASGTEWNGPNGYSFAESSPSGWQVFIAWRCRVVDVRQYTDEVSDG